MTINSLRSAIRMIILESVATTGYKMIFLAGLPGSGKSTLLKQLGIADKFTNCNIDRFFEPELEENLGTKNLHDLKVNFLRLHYARKEKLANGQELSPEEIDEYEAAAELNRAEGRLFRSAIKQFKEQIGEVCGVGANFIIDGTAVSTKKTKDDTEKYRNLGYDVAMIFVDIDVETSVERNFQRGEKGDRAIHDEIIRKQGARMAAQGNVDVYSEFFGENFFLVSNRGTFEEYQEEIESIRAGVQAFMES